MFSLGQPSNTSTTGFGPSSQQQPSLFSSLTNKLEPQQQQQQPAPLAPLLPQIAPRQQDLPSTFITHPFQYIHQCYDQASINYKFRTFFYNLSWEKSQLNQESMFPKPLGVSDEQWEQVKRNNPDPKKFFAVVANGFPALRERRDWQLAQSEALAAKLEVLYYDLLIFSRLGTIDSS
jgi:hypothetical protein